MSVISTSTRTKRREGFTPTQRESILDAPCHYCGTSFPTEIDHVIPWSRGGSDDIDNLVPACYRCNREKLDLTPEEWEDSRRARGATWPPASRGAILTDLIRGIVDESAVMTALEADEELVAELVGYVDEAHRVGTTPGDRSAMLASLLEGGASK